MQQSRATAPAQRSAKPARMVLPVGNLRCSCTKERAFSCVLHRCVLSDCRFYYSHRFKLVVQSQQDLTPSAAEKQLTLRSSASCHPHANNHASFGAYHPVPALMHALSVLSSVSSFAESANSLECLYPGVRDSGWHATFYYSLLTVVAFLPMGILSVLALFWFGFLPRYCSSRGNESGGGRGIGGNEKSNVRCCGMDLAHNLTASLNPNDEWAFVYDRYVPSTTDMFVGSSVLQWFLLLPSLVQLAFAVFECRYIGKATVRKPTYLLVSMEEQCWVGRHVWFLCGSADADPLRRLFPL